MFTFEEIANSLRTAKAIQVYDKAVGKYDYPCKCDLCGKENHGDLDSVAWVDKSATDYMIENFKEDSYSCDVITIGSACRKKLEKVLGYKLIDIEPEEQTKISEELAKEMIKDLEDAIQELRESSCPVEIIKDLNKVIAKVRGMN